MICQPAKLNCLIACGRELLSKLMRLGEQQSKYWLHARLYLLAYAFLLRLPSEAVPAVAGTGASQAQLFREGTLGIRQ